MWGETEGLMLPPWSAPFVGRREMRWEGGRGGKVGKAREGNEVAR